MCDFNLDDMDSDEINDSLESSIYNDREDYSISEKTDENATGGGERKFTIR